MLVSDHVLTLPLRLVICMESSRRTKTVQVTWNSACEYERMCNARTYGTPTS
jgi:hypothetical protein